MYTANVRKKKRGGGYFFLRDVGEREIAEACVRAGVIYLSSRGLSGLRLGRYSVAERCEIKELKWIRCVCSIFGLRRSDESGMLWDNKPI